MSYFTELDSYLFGQGTHYDIYKKLGAHLQTRKKTQGVCFDVWAPNAEQVFVIGEFNEWNEQSHEMERVEPETMGIFELFVPKVKKGSLYKYLIITKDGKWDFSKMYRASKVTHWMPMPEAAKEGT